MARTSSSITILFFDDKAFQKIFFSSREIFIAFYSSVSPKNNCSIELCRLMLFEKALNQIFGERKAIHFSFTEEFFFFSQIPMNYFDLLDKFTTAAKVHPIRIKINFYFRRSKNPNIENNRKKKNFAKSWTTFFQTLVFWEFFLAGKMFSLKKKQQNMNQIQVDHAFRLTDKIRRECGGICTIRMYLIYLDFGEQQGQVSPAVRAEASSWSILVRDSGMGTWRLSMTVETA